MFGLSRRFEISSVTMMAHPGYTPVTAAPAPATTLGLEVRPTSRFAAWTQSAELLSTDCARSAAGSCEAHLRVFGRAPRSSADKSVCCLDAVGRTSFDRLR